jgi:hypothetical protein
MRAEYLSSFEEVRMSSIHIRKKLESDMLHLPELKPLIGKTVEIIVREETEPTGAKNPYADFLALAGQDVVDPDAYRKLREASQL